MLRIGNPVVGIGEPLEVSIDGVAPELWEAASGIVITLHLDEDEDHITKILRFPPQPFVKVPTQELASGSYDVTVAVEGTPLEFTEPVLIGSHDVHDRVARYLDGLETERVAREQYGDVRRVGLMKARQMYADLGLADLAEEVDQELNPFDKTHRGAVDHCANGKRKKARVRVRLRPGSGEVLIRRRNGKLIAIEQYFTTVSQLQAIRTPISVAGLQGKIDVFLNCSGGGLQGQASASSLAIAKALQDYDTGLRPLLKEAKLLTSDARVRERKKYGQRGARARFQFSKR